MKRYGALTALVVAGFFTPVTFSQAVGDTDTTTASSVTISLPKLVDSSVPKNVTPTLGGILLDRPKPYKDRCHTQQNLTKSESACEYGNPKSKTTIVLFGDSHALSWFPAIEKLANAKNWKMVSLTMSSCWPSDILAWNSTTNLLMSNCSVWRKETLKDIAALKPSIVFVSGTKGFATVDSDMKIMTGDARTSQWEAGMIRTIDKLKLASTQVVYLADTPVSAVDSPTCLKAHRENILACATPYNKAVSTSWLSEEKKVATEEGVTWVDPTPWICSTDPCSPLSGKYVIFVDKGHLTASFARTLESPLWARVSSY